MTGNRYFLIFGERMFSLLTFLIGAIFNLLKSKQELIIQICLHKKELEILKRQNQKKRLKFNHCDRTIFSILNRIGNIKETLSIVKPETVPGWQKHLIKRFWTYKTKNRVGRPPVHSEIKQIILSMKNDNLYWGYKKIQGELKKLGISLDQKTIRNILTDFRRKGKVRKSITWKMFLRLQLHSIYAMAERFIRSVRREALDYYFLISEKQVTRILQEYLEYYNSKRPHQGIAQSVPIGYKPQLHGRVHKIPILGDLCNHYIRSAT